MSNSNKELYYKLMSLKAADNTYVINSSVASTPNKMNALEQFVRDQVLEAIQKIKGKKQNIGGTPTPFLGIVVDGTYAVNIEDISSVEDEYK